MKRQIRGEIAWQRLQRRKIEPFVTVGDDEVAQVIDRLERVARHRRISGRRDLPLGDSGNRRRGRRPMPPRIVQQIRAGALLRRLCPPIFRSVDRGASAAISAGSAPSSCPPSSPAWSRQMPVGAVSDPIPIPAAFRSSPLVDTRQVLVADPRDARAEPEADVGRAAGRDDAGPGRGARPAARPATAGAWAAAAAPPAAAQRIGAEVISNDQVRVRELPPALQQMLLDLSVGQATPAFGSPERVSVLVLCGRDDPPAVNAPELRPDLQPTSPRSGSTARAQRYLRDLRRDAVIDYR